MMNLTTTPNQYQPTKTLRTTCVLSHTRVSLDSPTEAPAAAKPLYRPSLVVAGAVEEQIVTAGSPALLGAPPAPSDPDLTWRRSLRKGDEIAFEIMDINEWWQSFRSIDRIERGRIYAGGFAFDIETGIERRRGKAAFRLVRPTAEGKRLLRRHEMISAIRKVDMEKLDDDELHAIAHLCGLVKSEPAPRAEEELTWRRSLKAGDEIAVVHHEDGDKSYKIDTIYSVTSETICDSVDPWLAFRYSIETGRLLCNLNPEPCPKGCTECGELYSITKPTPEIREQIRLAKLLRQYLGLPFLSVRQLRAIAVIGEIDTNAEVE
ncbi:hypothetical protein [Capsulimonas corticalis]|nr:hypothetical protein [Capsulimonas corticalis]